MHKNGCHNLIYNEFHGASEFRANDFGTGFFQTIAAQMLKKYKITTTSKFCTTRCANKR